jgi:glycosyltransferase involved in cell wall biosynthesis
VNIFHVNPDRLHPLLASNAVDLGLDECLNVCVPFWEAPRLPRSWLYSLNAMDILLAPTRFVGQAIVSDLPGSEVLEFAQAVYLPEGVAADRERWGIPVGRVAFVTSLAIASSIDRKNPWATIEAFKLAFPTEDKAMLIIKVNNPDFPAHLKDDMRRLRAACSPRPDIKVIEEPLTYVEVLSLYDSCDVFISLHRSEGLGLGLLESMSLGKPVIGTGWSGNMDFMTSEDSIPIPYRLVDIEVPLTSPYHRSNLCAPAQWAEADTGVAAEWMRRLAESPELRSKTGAAALKKAEEMRSVFAAGSVLGGLDDALTRLRTQGRRPDQTRSLGRLGHLGYRGLAKRMAKALYVRYVAR